MRAAPSIIIRRKKSVYSGPEEKISIGPEHQNRKNPHFKNAGLTRQFRGAKIEINKYLKMQRSGATTGASFSQRAAVAGKAAKKARLLAWEQFTE
ncbi:protein of unknown function [Ruminococcaceae bacterium BL-6]|nr:protein of unknown function [Ruminococcaceae bacterium BL-6]